MAYYRGGRRYQSAPLTPPAELVGHLISWRPKGTDGRRGAAVYGTCTAYDAEHRVITVEVRQETSPWQPNPTRTVVLPLSAGPFSLV